MYKHKLNKLYRIIDVNINRSREALRVIEDITRLYLDDENLTKLFKKTRHSIANTVKNNPALLSNRDAGSDVGKKYYVKLENKNNLKDLIFANFKRVQESLRVLEEVSKIVLPNKSSIYKRLRFSSYIIEKKVYERF